MVVLARVCAVIMMMVVVVELSRVVAVAVCTMQPWSVGAGRELVDPGEGWEGCDSLLI